MTAVDTDAPAPAQPLRSEVGATHVVGTATEVRLSARGHEFTVDEPAELGGADKGANPVEHLLSALGSCQVITYQVWAEKLGVRLDGIDITLAGDIDLRGFFGADDAVRPGFQGIELDVTLTGPEPQERYDALVAEVDKHCPVADNLANGVPIRAQVNVRS